MRWILALLGAWFLSAVERSYVRYDERKRKEDDAVVGRRWHGANGAMSVVQSHSFRRHFLGANLSANQHRARDPVRAVFARFGLTNQRRVCRLL